jgi:hypothetical protein
MILIKKPKAIDENNFSMGKQEFFLKREFCDFLNFFGVLTF